MPTGFDSVMSINANICRDKDEWDSKLSRLTPYMEFYTVYVCKLTGQA